MATARMTATELLALHEKVCNDARALMRRKNHDYAGSSGNTPFANFETCEDFGLASTEVGMMIRYLDKVKRLANFMLSGKFLVEDEGVEDTVRDMVNYAILMYAKMQERREIERMSPIVEPAVNFNAKMDAEWRARIAALPLNSTKQSLELPSSNKPLFAQEQPL